MMKSAILGAFAAVSLPVLAFAAPTFQPSVDAVASTEQAVTMESADDSAPLVTVRETESRKGRGRDRDRGRGRP
ncbi:MAG: hypothetical protein ACK4JB_08245 [Reyranella sp.]